MCCDTGGVEGFTDSGGRGGRRGGEDVDCRCVAVSVRENVELVGHG